MFKKEQQKEKAVDKYSGSKIMAFLTKFSGAIYDKVKNSFVGSLLCGYDKLNTTSENGLFAFLISKLKMGSKFFRPVKRVISKLVLQSILVLKIRMFLWSFLSARVNVYGLFFMTSGVGSLLISFMRHFLFETSRLSLFDCFISVLLIVLSIPLLFSSICMAEAIRNSKFMNVLLFDFLGVKSIPFERKMKAISHNNTAWVAGILFCTLSYWFRPHQILLFIGLVLYMISVLFTPETGVVCLFFAIPFLSRNQLIFAILYTAVCWFLKYIRGKRTFKTDLLSVVVIIFAFITFSTCIISGNFDLSLRPTLMFLCYVLAFFLVENLIKSKEWLNRCMKASLLSFLIVSVFGVFGIVVSKVDSMFIRSILEAGNGKNIFSTLMKMDIKAEYIVMLLPAAFSVMVTARKKNKPIAIITIVASIVCLFVTYMYGAWIGAFVGMFMFFLIGSKKTLAVMFLVTCFLPFAVFYISPSYLAHITNISSFTGKATAWLGNISNSLNMIFDFFFRGSGLGTYESVYSLYLKLGVEVGGFGLLMFICIVWFMVQKNITAYSKECSGEGRLISLSGMAGVVSLLITGLGSDVWHDPQICVLFWLMLGISSAAVNIEKKNFKTDDLLLNENY